MIRQTVHDPSPTRLWQQAGRVGEVAGAAFLAVERILGKGGERRVVVGVVVADGYRADAEQPGGGGGADNRPAADPAERGGDLAHPVPPLLARVRLLPGR